MKANCLTAEELSDYVYGKLPEPEMDSAAAHVDDCDACQATIVSLGERSDTFVNELRGPAKDDPLESEEACRLALGRMLATPDLIEPSDEHARMPEQIGGYEVVGRLGIGGMGTVFKAVHPKLKRTVAIKILPTARWANATAVARFTREMEVIGQVDCPQIVRANDAGEEHGMHYLVMEYVDGLDLSRVVNRLGQLPVAEACEIACQAAVGLQYAHENHLVHRDIKPSNLMLSNVAPRRRNDGKHTTTVKILDLGLALLGEEHADDRDELTTVGQLMGTLDYMSPEQGMDSHDVDIRADIYSLGATLFKLLTGTAPFSGPQYNTLLKRVTALANKPAPPIASLRPDLPEELAAIIDRMLAKDPAERLASPKAVADVLAPFADNANLVTLLHDAQRAKEPQPDRPPVVLPDLLKAHSPAEPKPAPRGFSGFARRMAIAATLLMMGGLAATIIYLSTEQGELIVRAADPNVKIRVTRGDRTVKQMELVPGDNSIKVRSGQYQVELLTHHDRLEVSRDHVTIRRGDRIVVQVHQRRSDAAGGGAMGMPMGGGMDMGAGMMMDMGGGGGAIPAMGMGSDEMMKSMAGDAAGATAPMGGGGAMPGAMMGVAPGMSPGLPGMMPGAAGMGSQMAPGGMAPAGGGAGDMAGIGGLPMGGADFGAAGGAFPPGGTGMDAGIGPPVQPELKYDGKTYRGWLVELETERKPERLTEAVRAFAALGEGDEALAGESARAILQLMRRYGATTPGGSPRGTLVKTSQSVLLDIPPRAMVEALLVELASGNTASRRFSLNLVQHISGFSRNAPVYKEAQRTEQELIRLLVQLPQDESAQLRADSLETAVYWVQSQNRDVREFPPLLPALRMTLEAPEHFLLSVATRALATHEPDNPQLVPALLRQLSLEKGNRRGNSIATLGMLGPRAAPAVDSLIAILGELKPEKVQPGMGGGLGGAGMPGGMGMGGGGGGMMSGGMGMGGMMPGGMGGFGGMGGGGFGGMHVDTYLQAIRTLAAIGPAAKRALPVLNKLRTTENIFSGRPYPADVYLQDIAATIAKIEGRSQSEGQETPDGITKDAEVTPPRE